jgi:alkaline phosphatase
MEGDRAAIPVRQCPGPMSPSSLHHAGLSSRPSNGGPLRPRGDDAEPLTDEIVMDCPERVYRQEAAVPMGSETHSGEDVIAYAVGPWAHLVDGSMEQHTLHHVITHAYGWSATAAMVEADEDDDEDEDDDD